MIAIVGGLITGLAGGMFGKKGALISFGAIFFLKILPKLVLSGFKVAFTKVLPFLLKNILKVGRVGIGAGMGLALSVGDFKKGMSKFKGDKKKGIKGDAIGGISHMLFGEAITKETSLMSAMGTLAKQTLKWASWGFMIGGPTGAAAGALIGAGGVALNAGLAKFRKYLSLSDEEKEELKKEREEKKRQRAKKWEESQRQSKLRSQDTSASIYANAGALTGPSVKSTWENFVTSGRGRSMAGLSSFAQAQSQFGEIFKDRVVNRKDAGRLQTFTKSIGGIFDTLQPGGNVKGYDPKLSVEKNKEMFVKNVAERLMSNYLLENNPGQFKIDNSNFLENLLPNLLGGADTSSFITKKGLDMVKEKEAIKKQAKTDKIEKDKKDEEDKKTQKGIYDNTKQIAKNTLEKMPLPYLKVGNKTILGWGSTPSKEAASNK